MRRLIVVSNRSPYHLELQDARVHMTRNVSGMVTGLEPVLASTRGMWIAWGNPPQGPPQKLSQSLSRQKGRIYKIPPHNPTFDLKLISLNEDEIRHYYLGFSNSTLWPLAHNFLGLTLYNEQDWDVYYKVNRKFAEAVAAEVRPTDLIWVNDYQLSLVPYFLRSILPQPQIGFFWHIPFPPLDLFRTLPWRKEFLEGLLGADLLGFHCRSYARNFLSAVEELLGLDVSFKRGLVRMKRTVKVSAFPMGIDFQGIQKLVSKHDVRTAAQTLRKEIGGEHIVLGVDRLDYSKGIPERLLAVEKFFEDNPRYIGSLSFMQISVPSRIELPDYRRMRQETENAIGRINGRFSQGAWSPIRYFFRALPFKELVTYYLASDICLVTPLRDGMNLVAKEFVAAQAPDKGMLVLSEFAGAAEELKDAVLVNPHSIPSMVKGLKKALEMSPEERIGRMNRMRERLERRTVKQWGRNFLQKLAEPSKSTKSK